MQMKRLFEITWILMERGRVTAGELARRFEVSTRTIYRDVDALSAAGIPVYASKGKGGGIQILPEFVISRSLLSAGEQSQLLAGLQSLSSVDTPEVRPALEKLAALFGKTRSSWLEVDFSPWGGGIYERERFACIRDAILRGQVLRFGYHSARREQTVRSVEPLKIVFKGQAWYLYGYCRTRQAFRVFRLSRMSGVEATGERFEREIPEHVEVDDAGSDRCMLPVTLWLDKSLGYRIYDDFKPEQVETLPDGGFHVRAEYPKGDWLISFVLSLGPSARVLEPPWLCREMERLLQAMLEYYQTPTH